MRRELIESYYEEYQRELERFLESDPEMFSLEAEIHYYIEILEPVLRDAGQEMWQALDRIISAKNALWHLEWQIRSRRVLQRYIWM